MFYALIAILHFYGLADDPTISTTQVSSARLSPQTPRTTHQRL
jgi:hypothetical protein